MARDRRQEMVQALIELIAADGVEAASVRRVATRVGVSIGAVQHHFPTKSGMLVAASDELFERTAARVAEVSDGQDEETALRTTAAWLIPPDSEDQLARVWISLATLAVFDEAAGATYRRQWQRLREGLAAMMASVRPRRSADSVMAAATELLGLCDGLALSVLAEPGQVDPERARQVVDAWLTSWLSG